MRSTFATLALLASVLVGCSSPAADTPPAIPAIDDAAPVGPTVADLDRLDTLIAWMSGSFDSAEQAAADRSYFDIRLHAAPIWTENPGGGAGSVRWLYVEQAMADQPGKPYRQRVYRVSALGRGVFKSEVLELPGDPQTYAGAWKTPGAFAALKQDQLVERDGCAVLLTDRKDAFVGGTHEHDCTTTFRGAAYTTNETTITADLQISWDRGFDEAGKQVWGATKSGYVFRKRAR
jgi:CpeT protein